DTLTIRPQRPRAIGSSSGLVTWKKPCRETSITRCHCASLMPAMGASSWMPALLTSTSIRPSASRASIAAAVAAPSATSKATARALPPRSRIAAASASARSMLVLAWTMTSMPASARAWQVAPPMSPLPPVTRARRLGVVGFIAPCCQRARRRRQGPASAQPSLAAGDHRIGMQDAERVLLAGLAGGEQLGLAFQRPWQVVDAGHRQLDPAQRHQHAGRGTPALAASQQAAMHGHGLGAVLAQRQ